MSGTSGSKKYKHHEMIENLLTTTSNYLRKRNKRLITSARDSLFPGPNARTAFSSPPHQPVIRNEDFLLRGSTPGHTRKSIRSKSFFYGSFPSFLVMILIAFFVLIFFLFLVITIWKLTTTRSY